MNLPANLGSADWYTYRPTLSPDDPSLSYRWQSDAGRDKVISGLRDSMTYRLAVQVYQGHHDPGDGRCRRCGLSAPCIPRGHAASVIQAAGDDPGRYDAQPPGGRHRHADGAPRRYATDGPYRRVTGRRRP